MKKILCIVGPTATGKTTLAIKLSYLFPSVLISADSRQVYRGMDIVTGKDHPVDTRILGIDIFDPQQESSVSGWYILVEPALNASQLPIIVGGTGLYVHAVTVGIPTMHVPPNKELRDELNHLSVKDLVAKLAIHNPNKLASMNQSDRANSRRLIRAIELAHTPHITKVSPPHDSLIVGLRPLESNYTDLIRQRVISRLENGAIQETQALLTKYPPDLPSMSALGYKHLLKYLRSELSRDELVDSWTHDELSYAKRQMTWFKKIPNIHWFESDNPNTFTQVADLVKSWYHSS